MRTDSYHVCGAKIERAETEFTPNDYDENTKTYSKTVGDFEIPADGNVIWAFKIDDPKHRDCTFVGKVRFKYGSNEENFRYHEVEDDVTISPDRTHVKIVIPTTDIPSYKLY